MLCDTNHADKKRPKSRQHLFSFSLELFSWTSDASLFTCCFLQVMIVGKESNNDMEPRVSIY